MKRSTAIFTVVLGLAAIPRITVDAAAAGFEDVAPILQEFCVECHDPKEPEGRLSLDSYDDLLKGGESGRAILPGQPDTSLLVRAIEGTWDRKGRNRTMPPGDRAKLKPAQIATLREWIRDGARPPAETSGNSRLVVPTIKPTAQVRPTIHALAASPDGTRFATGRRNRVDLWDATSRTVIRSLEGLHGAVTALAFSPDGATLAAAAGEPGLAGEMALWKVGDGSHLRTWNGHRDAIYALDLSPDGRTLVTGSYDYQLKLWDAATGNELRTIAASQGALFAAAFRAGGTVLASASADRTAKLFNAATGERLETLGQALKELLALAWNPAGTRLATGGGDNRIRIYSISTHAAEGSNPLVESRFAHEGAIQRLTYSRDGRWLASAADNQTIALFETGGLLAPGPSIEPQPDLPTGLAFIQKDSVLVVSRLDGSLGYYQTSDGKPSKPSPPEISSVEPPGIQREIASPIRVSGKHLGNNLAFHSTSPHIRGRVTSVESNSLTLEVIASPETPRGPVPFTLQGPGGTSKPATLHIDDVRQIVRNETSMFVPKLPASVWSRHTHGGTPDDIVFDAAAGDELTFDLETRAVGGRGNFSLTLLDAHLNVLARNDTFAGSDDPWLTHRFERDGRYRIRVTEESLLGGEDFLYRLTLGPIPYITGVFPLSVTEDEPGPVDWLGTGLTRPRTHVNTSSLDGAAEALRTPAGLGDIRRRREPTVAVVSYPAPVESEPNDLPPQAATVPVPSSINGRFQTPGDTDLFRFRAEAGRPLILETFAWRAGSPADTRIELLSPDGQRLPQRLLRAVRNSAITFRNEDANDNGIRFENWEEMEVNEYVYANGEVMRLFRAPQGPDSDSLLYASWAGKRRAWFNTTAIAHPLDESCYVVEPLPLGTVPPPNGLPVFTTYFENDDDGDRESGPDSRVLFTPATTGDVLVRVTESTRRHGDRFTYRLVIRDPEPRFNLSLTPTTPTVLPGGGISFTVIARRLDGFDGEIQVHLDRLPAGWHATSPLVIQSGMDSAQGTLSAAPTATPGTDAEWDHVSVLASAKASGRLSIQSVNSFGRVRLGTDKPRLLATLTPLPSDPGYTHSPPAITLSPGETVRAHLAIQRQGIDDAVRFEILNLPHGVIVDNLGLNGITFLKGEREREIFLTAARWVPPAERPIFAEDLSVRQASAPVLIRIRPPRTQAQLP